MGTLQKEGVKCLEPPCGQEKTSGDNSLQNIHSSPINMNHNMKSFPALPITLDLNLCIFECLSFGRVFLFYFCGFADIHLHICLFFKIGIVSRLEMLEVCNIDFQTSNTSKSTNCFVQYAVEALCNQHARLMLVALI